MDTDMFYWNIVYQITSFLSPKHICIVKCFYRGTVKIYVYISVWFTAEMDSNGERDNGKEE
jgi:hypothetical protein